MKHCAQRMKYMFVLPTRTGGGAERVVSVLSSALAERGISVGILQFESNENEYPVSQKVIVRKMKPEKGSVLVKFKKLQFVRKWVKVYRPEYVIPFLGNTHEYSLLATMLSKSKCIGTVRNNPEKNVKSRSQRIMRDIILLMMDGVLVQTKAQKEYFMPAIQKKCFVIPNPVGDAFLKAEYTYRAEVQRIIAVGRLVEQKNYKLLIDSFEPVHNKYPQVILDIYGEGILREQLEGCIFDKNLGGCVILHGTTRNITQALAKADVYVLSSDFEGFPNALMEAMAVGLACISTNCPTGPAELIDNEHDGLLVPVNSEKEMSSAIFRMMEDKDFRIQCGVNAKKRILDSLSSEKITEQFIKEVDKI